MMQIKIGNLKIGRDTAIINMGSALLCPSDKLGLCKCSLICYAKKAERQYPAVLPYRNRQADYWINNTAEKISADINNYIKNKKGIKFIRFNESGDFYGQECVEKLKYIADHLSLIVYTYTAREDLIFDNLPGNLVINGSCFLISNEFRAVKNTAKKQINVYPIALNATNAK
jgi:hypothetical protein